jgi:hypothetical protein
VAVAEGMGVRVGVCVAVNVGGGRVCVRVEVAGLAVCGSVPKQPDSKSISNSHALIHKEWKDLGMG